MSLSWQTIRAEWTKWVLLAGFTAFWFWAYVTTTGLPSLLFVTAAPLLGHLFIFKGSWKALAPFAIATGLMLLVAFLRSDFIVALGQGQGIAEAYGSSKRYFEAPIVIWFIAWAAIFAARSLDEARADTVFSWLIYVLVALAGIQLIEAISHFAVRQMLSDALFHSRNQMLIVGFSNTNCALLMMFWPLALYQAAKGKPLPIGFAAIAIVAAGFASDTNAHLLALAASTAVFFAVKYWPASLRRVAPERVAAVLTLVPALLFPVLIIALMRTGIAEKIKTDLLPSWAARIDIWTFTVSRALEKPLWGWGYESSRQFDPAIPNHPHNMALQAWLELGIPGLLILAGFWFWLFWSLGGKTVVADATPATAELRGLEETVVATDSDSLAARFKPYLMAQVTAFLIIGTLSYGLWRAWFYCLGAFAAMAAIIAVAAASRVIKLRN